MIHITLYKSFLLNITNSPSRWFNRSSTDSSFDPLKCSTISSRETCKKCGILYQYRIIFEHLNKFHFEFGEDLDRLTPSWSLTHSRTAFSVATKSPVQCCVFSQIFGNFLAEDSRSRASSLLDCFKWVSQWYGEVGADSDAIVLEAALFLMTFLRGQCNGDSIILLGASYTELQPIISSADKPSSSIVRQVLMLS